MGKPKILVVDDNREFCDTVKDVLEINGLEVLTAYDGQSALETVRRERVRLILLDLVMPGMDGVATIKAIRKIPSAVPITIVTAFGEDNILQEAFKAGANNKLGKPFDFEKLFACISQSD